MERGAVGGTIRTLTSFREANVTSGAAEVPRGTRGTIELLEEVSPDRVDWLVRFEGINYRQ